MRLPPLALASLLALPLALTPTACASTARVEQVRRAPEPREPFVRVAIVAIVGDPALRRELELQIRHAFANVGVAAVMTFEDLSGRAGEPDNEEILRELEERGTDALLLVRVLPVTEGATEGDPGPSVDLRAELRAGFQSSVAADGPARARIATDLHALAGLEFVWAGRSEPTETELVDELVEPYAQAVVDALIDADLVVRSLTPGAIEARD